MNRQKLVFIAVICLFFAPAVCRAQAKTTRDADKSNVQNVQSSPAYAEVVLRKAELIAELEELLESYTEEYPKVQKARYEADLLQKEMTRLLAVNNSQTAKLTLALGKLLVRKAEFETELWEAQKQYGGEHPNVKRAKRKFEAFNQAVREIFP